MPLKIVRVKGGFKLTHDKKKKFSKLPQTREKAMAQLRAIHSFK